ncbi:hypothetical protein FRB90_004433 [Tulasnella sp. 427]|nr:hypothetical protein FRB90_004433 [Tulasnella sp. 427]
MKTAALTPLPRFAHITPPFTGYSGMINDFSILQALFPRGPRKSPSDRTPIYLPQEILNQIIEEYQVSFPQEKIYPLLFASPDLYEAALPCLYREIVFMLDDEKREKYLYLIQSFVKHGGRVRGMDFSKFTLKGFNDRAEYDEAAMCAMFIRSLEHLPNLQKISIHGRGEQLPAGVLVALSQLRQLEVLKLTNACFVGDSLEVLQLPAIDSLRELKLSRGWKDHTFSVPLAAMNLNPNMRRFELVTEIDYTETETFYSAVQLLKDQPDLIFPNMRTMRLPQPLTPTDFDCLLDLLRRCPGLHALHLDSRLTFGAWGPLIDEG